MNSNIVWHNATVTRERHEALNGHRGAVIWFTGTAFISPNRAEREKARQLVGEQDFIEIYCQCSLEVCESRDVKGLLKKNCLTHYLMLQQQCSKAQLLQNVG
jgi:adenylylsulfate kinase-like enzyme